MTHTCNDECTKAHPEPGSDAWLHHTHSGQLVLAARAADKDPLVALAEQTGAFTIPGRIDAIGGTVRVAIDTGLYNEPDKMGDVLRSIERQVQETLGQLANDGVSVVPPYGHVPDSDKPGSERVLHTDGVSGSLMLKLIDATTGRPGDDLLSVGPTPGSGIPTTGTGEEWADIALAILGHVLKRPAVSVNSKAIDLLDELVASDSIQGEHMAEARAILGMETDDSREPDVEAEACTHPETRQETHTYCATDGGCGACLG